MSGEEKFYFDINNIKTDMEIENMIVTDAHVNMLKRYHDREITAADLINDVRQKAIRGEYKYE